MTRDHIHQLISFIDLTTLDSTDTIISVLNLVRKANNGIEGCVPAAVCIYPNFAQLVSQHTLLPIAVVAGGFPTGQTFIEAKAHEVKLAAASPASEIDIVINRGKVLEGEYTYLVNEIRQCRTVSEGKILKVILETGELNEEQIQISSKIAIHEGADFIKTSTGKSAIGATPEAVMIMCGEIKNWFAETGRQVGIKPSGGIKTYSDAMVYYDIVKEILGEEWLKPELFRIGASSLFDNLRSDLESL